MTNKIYKYSIPLTNCYSGMSPTIELKLPKTAELLTVCMQNIHGDEAVLYAKIDTSHEENTRYFKLFYTGIEMPPFRFEYIGTITDRHGLVYHLFEEFEVLEDE